MSARPDMAGAASNADVIRDLTRAKAVFQLRAVAAVITDTPRPLIFASRTHAESWFLDNDRKGATVTERGADRLEAAKAFAAIERPFGGWRA